MAKRKSGIIATIDGLPYIVKLLLCLPVLNIVWGLYRLVKGIETSNLVLLIVGIIWLILGGFVLWVIDLVSVIIWGKPVLFVG